MRVASHVFSDASQQRTRDASPAMRGDYNQLCFASADMLDNSMVDRPSRFGNGMLGWHPREVLKQVLSKLLLGASFSGIDRCREVDEGHLKPRAALSEMH